MAVWDTFSPNLQRTFPSLWHVFTSSFSSLDSLGLAHGLFSRPFCHFFHLTFRFVGHVFPVRPYLLLALTQQPRQKTTNAFKPPSGFWNGSLRKRPKISPPQKVGHMRSQYLFAISIVGIILYPWECGSCIRFGYSGTKDIWEPKEKRAQEKLDKNFGWERNYCDF